MAELLKGRWVKVPPEEGGVAEFCDVSAVLADAEQNKRGLTKGEVTQVGGAPALALSKKKGDQTLTYYVAAEGDPYLLKYSAEGGKEPGFVELSAFGTEITIVAPPADEVVDPAKLGG